MASPSFTSAVLVASGDLRETANRAGWPAQESMERRLVSAFERLDVTVTRAHPYVEERGHGFISTQRHGMDVFNAIDRDVPVIVAEAVWQYSHHVLAGLRRHRGPILTVANWDGTWPGLVGLLNLNASMTKMGVAYSTIWSVDFEDPWFVDGLRSWVEDGLIEHDLTHVHPFDSLDIPAEESAVARRLASELRDRQAILGVLDEGCMGMYNAIFDDELINPMGIYKERLSQSALLAEMREVGDKEVREVFDWLTDRGMRFNFGTDPATELTRAQVDQQLSMYIAAARMADRFGCDAIGIQYQQGLAQMTAASDLAEGLLNERDRPPARRSDGSEIRPGEPIIHFNEVDEGVAVDALITNIVWNELQMDPSTTLHDIRWGERYAGDGIDEFVWVMEISGSVPPSHLEGGYAGAVSERQPPAYFPLGGGTIKGVSRPGPVVWSRVFIMDGRLHLDIGRASAITLPSEETQRRWDGTTSQWPIMHAVLHGVSRNQLMARHRANHLNVVYATDEASADRGLRIKAAMFAELGVEVHFCGDVH